MCTPTCSCISCTVVFGQQLVSLCHLWIEITSKADQHLDLVVYDIEASTSALRQLQAILDDEKRSETKVFTPAGRQEIETLSVKCNLIFKAVVLLVQKAADRKKESAENEGESEDEDSRVSGGPLLLGNKLDKKARKNVAADEEAEEEKDPAPETSDLLARPVPSLTSPKTFGLIGRLSGQWDWLSNRIKHCQIQLRWVRKGLLLHLQMGRLTTLANQ